MSDTAVSAEAAAGNEAAEESTIARRASGESSKGGSGGGGGRKRVGCDLSGGGLVEFVRIINRQIRRVRRTEFKKLGVNAHPLQKYSKPML